MFISLFIIFLVPLFVSGEYCYETRVCQEDGAADFKEEMTIRVNRAISNSCLSIKRRFLGQRIPDGIYQIFPFGNATGVDVFCDMNKDGGWMDIMLRSEGCDDKGRTGCGIAKIEINGKDISLHRRGHNVAIINYRTGQMISVASFDTHGISQSDERLKAYIEGAATDSIIAVAIQDSGYRYLSKAISVLTSVGARNAVATLRSSYALLGYKGTKGVNWISEAFNERYKGPSVIRKRIELGKYTCRPMS